MRYNLCTFCSGLKENKIQIQRNKVHYKFFRKTFISPENASKSLDKKETQNKFKRMRGRIYQSNIKSVELNSRNIGNDEVSLVL